MGTLSLTEYNTATHSAKPPYEVQFEFVILKLCMRSLVHCSGWFAYKVWNNVIWDSNENRIVWPNTCSFQDVLLEMWGQLLNTKAPQESYFFNSWGGGGGGYLSFAHSARSSSGHLRESVWPESLCQEIPSVLGGEATRWDLFREQWFRYLIHVDDYLQLIKPSARSTKPAIRMWILMLEWAKAMRARASRFRENFLQGWEEPETFTLATEGFDYFDLEVYQPCSRTHIRGRRRERTSSGWYYPTTSVNIQTALGV